MFYGSVVWDPWLIVVQIVCIQCLYYVTLGFFIAVLVGTRVPRISLFYLFDYPAVTVSTVTGWCVVASFLLSSFAGLGAFCIYGVVYLFDYAAVSASTVMGWCAVASFLLSCISGAVFIFYLIERAKKCLDFSATLYIIHLFLCIVYGGWPSSITWWVVTGTGVAIMSLLGEYLCVRRELREIPITRYRSNV